MAWCLVRHRKTVLLTVSDEGFHVSIAVKIQVEVFWVAPTTTLHGVITQKTST